MKQKIGREICQYKLDLGEVHFLKSHRKLNPRTFSSNAYGVYRWATKIAYNLCWELHCFYDESEINRWRVTDNSGRNHTLYTGGKVSIWANTVCYHRLPPSSLKSREIRSITDTGDTNETPLLLPMYGRLCPPPINTLAALPRGNAYFLLHIVTCCL